MGAVYEEFQRELARLEKACGGDTRREVVQLFLLALEREELVSIGYRESLMERRLAGMPIPDEVREIIRHALVWIWKDEEMHTIFIRGAILKIGGVWLRMRAFLTQAAGGLGGWASSVMQHSSWRRAPLSRLIAGAMTFAGGLVGKVPADVRKHLQFGPFRNFCEFNIDAEMTAAVCWYRIADLAAAQPDLDAQLSRDFRQVAQDEDRHGVLFRILHDVLTDEDRLADGVTVSDLVERIRAVGEEFLPRSHRVRSDLENPLGSGQPVTVMQSADRADKRALFRRLLDESKLAEAIRRRAEFLGRTVNSLRIAIKPSFMLGYHRKDLSPLTDVELLHDLAAYLRGLGCHEIAVIEGRNIYDRFFRNRSVADVARYFGIPSDHFRVVDTADEQVEHHYRRGMAQYTIARSWRDADFRISFPKIRSHPIEMALLSMGNVEWVGGRCDEYLFLERQADRATAIMMLLDEFPPHFAILDGFENAPDGLVGVMGCRRPRELRRFYAGSDALAVDTVALQHLGVKEPQYGSILRTARHWFGGSPRTITIVGETSPMTGWRGPYSNELRALLSMLAYPVYVMGSGRGQLFVPEMDEQAFPPIAREGWFLKLRRRAVRRLLGLRIPER
ncbi:MAG TPA: DUF362 domain-containing protein [Planctomycetaceae bacterium]|nr:DUF362 domain-containing protein [Planctomycetaceae bacterium]